MSSLALAWSLEKMIQYQNSTQTSSMTSQLLCLATLFSYSIVMLTTSLAHHYLCKDDSSSMEGQPEESLSVFITSALLALFAYLPLNIMVLPTDQIE
jgi:hypothetical protein